jgi:hypothetical protein
MEDENPIGTQQLLPMLLSLSTADRMYILGFIFTAHPETAVDALTALHFRDLPVEDL